MVSRVGKMFVVKVYCQSTIKIAFAVVVKKMRFCFVQRIETSIQTSIQRPSFCIHSKSENVCSKNCDMR